MAAHHQLIVGFRSNATSSIRRMQHRRSGGKLVGRIPEINAHIVKVAGGKLRSCMASYASCKHVRFVERDRTFRAVPLLPAPRIKRSRTAAVRSAPNDEQFGRQWGLSKVEAVRAWRDAHTSPSRVRIAILDSGIDARHPDLRSKIVLRRNFSSSRTANDLHGHGTHVAGIAAAVTNNRIGVAGLSYNAASLMNIKVLDDHGYGSTSTLVRGILYAVRRGAQVINMSIGGYGNSRVLRDAVRQAWRSGVVLTAAAGNERTARRLYPAAIPQVIAVAAIGRNDRKTAFSNYGRWVDVAAPGASILSCWPHGRGYAMLSGTSQSTPFVSGLAALIKATRPRLGAAHIRWAIERGTDRIAGTGTRFRHGRINAYKALRLARRVRLSSTPCRPMAGRTSSSPSLFAVRNCPC